MADQDTNGGPEAAPHQAAAQSMYDGNNSVDHQLYGHAIDAGNAAHSVEIALRQALQGRQRDLAVTLGLSESERRTYNNDFAAMVRETGIDPLSTAPILNDARIDAHITAARGSGSVDETEVQRWQEEVRSGLINQYGSARAERILARTEAFIRAHPRLNTFLGVGNIGAQPKVRLALIEHVRRTERL